MCGAPRRGFWALSRQHQAQAPSGPETEALLFNQHAARSDVRSDLSWGPKNTEKSASWHATDGVKRHGGNTTWILCLLTLHTAIALVSVTSWLLSVPNYHVTELPRT